VNVFDPVRVIRTRPDEFLVSVERIAEPEIDSIEGAEDASE